MKLIKVICSACGKTFLKQNGRVNEAKKFNWNQYCSRICESKHKSRQKTIVCDNCSKSFKRSLHAISKYNYCSQSCAAIVNNKKYPKRHLDPELKVCIRCGKSFEKSTGNKKYCSMNCRREAEFYAPEELLNIIKNTFKKLGRVPSRREMPKGTDKACIRFFNSWNNSVLKAGFTPNRSCDDRMYKRVNVKALDGHLCDSISELLIDNWLYKNKIPHERDAYYPETHHKADWEIPAKNKKIFVEYFGLANDSPRYDRAVKEKIGLCNKHKISLISIYPKDIYPKIFLEDNLKGKFENFLIA